MASKNTTTDAQGKATLTGLADGAQVPITISKEGYQTYSNTITVDKDNLNLNIVLTEEEETTDDPEIIITIQKESGEAFTESEEVYFMVGDTEGNPLIGSEESLIYNGEPLHIKVSDINNSANSLMVYAGLQDSNTNSFVEILSKEYTIKSNKNTNVNVIIPDFVNVTVNVMSGENPVTNVGVDLDFVEGNEISGLLPNGDKVMRKSSNYNLNNNSYILRVPTCQYSLLKVYNLGTEFGINKINGYTLDESNINVIMDLLNITEDTTFTVQISEPQIPVDPPHVI